MATRLRSTSVPSLQGMGQAGLCSYRGCRETRETGHSDSRDLQRVEASDFNASSAQRGLSELRLPRTEEAYDDGQSCESPHRAFSLPALFFHLLSNSSTCSQLERQRVDGARYLSIIISSLNPNGPMCSAAENGGFLVDCAELKNPSSSNANNPTHTAFSRNLLAFLESLRIGSSGKAFLQVFSRFDFSGTSECRLVHSLAGKKPIGNQTLPWGSSIDPGGFMSLAKAVRELKVSKKAVGSLSVEAIVSLSPVLLLETATYLLLSQGSSYGRLTLQFLHDFWAAAQGVDPRARERSLEKGLLVPLDVSKMKVMCMSERDVKKELINDKVPYKRPLERYSEEDRPKLKDKKGRESSKGKDRGGFGGR